jgi:uncharacterized protein YqjF (DUF2071 family)
MLSDFDYRILDETAHRPWPMPTRPWILTQTWHHQLFAHWPVDEAVLRARVPTALPLDLFDGTAWLGIVPFQMSNVAPRGMPPMPLLSAFPELNVRTYVTIGGKPGVYFFSLDAGCSLAVAIARTLLGLPYYVADMMVETSGDEVRYCSRRESDHAELTARYRPVGPVQPAAPGTLEYFLTERYCLYTVDRSGRAHRLQIHHPRWPLQAAFAKIDVNTMADAAGITLPPRPPLLHFAKRQDVVAWGKEDA